MKKYKAELILNNNNVLAEGPFWDDKNNILYFTDIMSNIVYGYNVSTKELKEYPFHNEVGAVVLTNNDNFLFAARDGLYLVDPNTNIKKHLVKTEGVYRFNDGKCDKSGIFWAGTTSENEFKAKFYRYDGEFSIMLDSIGISNGISFDYDTMYYIDSPKKAVYGFDYSVKDRSIENQRVVYESEDFAPDGMTIDCNGNLWVAEWGNYKVSNINPGTKEIIGIIELPVARVTSCCFGGENMDELYITTAKTGNATMEVDTNPLAGAIFKAKLDICGEKSYRFDEKKI